MDFTPEELNEIEAHGKAARNRMIKELKLNVVLGDGYVEAKDLHTFCAFTTNERVMKLFDTLKAELSMKTRLTGLELMAPMVQGLALNLAQASAYLDKVREVKSRPGRETPATDDLVSSIENALRGKIVELNLNPLKTKAKKPAKKKRKGE